MDWANLCNGLGAFYDQAGEPQKAAQHLDKARLFLEKILKQSPDNGRACFLMSANCFYRKDIPQAKKYAAKAAEHGFAIPDEFVVGFGLDYREHYRNLPFVGVLRPEIYGA